MMNMLRHLSYMLYHDSSIAAWLRSLHIKCMMALSIWHDYEGVLEMSVYLDAIYPWLNVRIAFIKDKCNAVNILSSRIGGERELDHKVAGKSQYSKNEYDYSYAPTEDASVSDLRFHYFSFR